MSIMKTTNQLPENGKLLTGVSIRIFVEGFETSPSVSGNPIKETEKAYAFEVVRQGEWNKTELIWLPKSQMDFIRTYYESPYIDQPNEFKKIEEYFVPEWLGRKNKMI